MTYVGTPPGRSLPSTSSITWRSLRQIDLSADLPATVYPMQFSHRFLSACRGLGLSFREHRKRLRSSRLRSFALAEAQHQSAVSVPNPSPSVRVSRRHRATGRSGSDCPLDTGVASGAGRSVHHVACGVRGRLNCGDRTPTLPWLRRLKVRCL